MKRKTKKAKIFSRRRSKTKMNYYHDDNDDIGEENRIGKKYIILTISVKTTPTTSHKSRPEQYFSFSFLMNEKKSSFFSHFSL